MINNPSPAAVAGVAVLMPAAAGTAAGHPAAAAQRGYRHWLVIGVGAAVLVLIFLASR